MSAKKKIEPQGCSDEIAFDVSHLGLLFNCIEASAINDDRSLFKLRQATSLPSINGPSDNKPNSPPANTMTPQENTNLNCLPEFWRLLVLGKTSFRHENDYYASIRVLSRIQAQVSDLLKPYIKASLIATKEPGTMCEFEREMNGILEGGLTGTTGDSTPLKQEHGFVAGLAGDEKFLPLVEQMRSWEGDSVIVRGLLLLAHLNRIGGHTAFKVWLEKPSIILGGKSPLSSVAEGKWTDVADLADAILTGEPG